VVDLLQTNCLLVVSVFNDRFYTQQ